MRIGRLLVGVIIGVAAGTLLAPKLRQPAPGS